MAQVSVQGKVTADESLIFKFKNGAEIEELLD